MKYESLNFTLVHAVLHFFAMVVKMASFPNTCASVDFGRAEYMRTTRIANPFVRSLKSFPSMLMPVFPLLVLTFHNS